MTARWENDSKLHREGGYEDNEEPHHAADWAVWFKRKDGDRADFLKVQFSRSGIGRADAEKLSQRVLRGLNADD